MVSFTPMNLFKMDLLKSFSDEYITSHSHRQFLCLIFFSIVCIIVLYLFACLIFCCCWKLGILDDLMYQFYILVFSPSSNSCYCHLIAYLFSDQLVYFLEIYFPSHSVKPLIFLLKEAQL